MTPPTPRQQRARATDAQKSRFDERSSRHLTQSRVVSGPAWVVDGDTVKIRRQQIRLFGIDAPELNHPYGKKAKWELHRLCKGQAIRAEITDKDDYGRVVARCYLPDGRDLSAEMVKLGMAIDWPKFSSGKYKDLETPDARKKLFLADARQNGRMHVWKEFEETQQKTPATQYPT
ncbi:thermonuclease family protein [Primorskyibacter sp. S87]|uniref:thermonuclease family protein n=1 Tax=Primorskyibacter sp. S87 TaxID=3415126 RepID=UPI003C7D1BE5